MTRITGPSTLVELLFLIYFELGLGGRSLVKVVARAQLLGISISLSQVKRYSKRYRWRQRVAELDAEAREGAKLDALRSASEASERHQQIARAAVGGGATALRHLISSEQRLAEMSTGEIVRLLGFALGLDAETTRSTGDRREIATFIWNSLVVELVELFQRCNRLDERDDRSAAFGTGLDQLGDRLLEAAAVEGMAP